MGQERVADSLARDGDSVRDRWIRASRRSRWYMDGCPFRSSTGFGSRGHKFGGPRIPVQRGCHAERVADHGRRPETGVAGSDCTPLAGAARHARSGPCKPVGLPHRPHVPYSIGRQYHLKSPRLASTLVADLSPYDLVLFRNPIPAKPRAYLSRRPERAATHVDPMALFTRPDFLSGEVDVIEAPEV